MNPRLIAIAGPLKDATLTLTEEETSIGREASNRLCLPDSFVSRRHCVIRKQDGKFLLRDLESMNGTYVNGVPVKERVLEHGDKLAVGDSLFSFLIEEGDERPSAVFFNETQVPTSTVQLKADDALYLNPDRVLASLPAGARVARDLNALLKIATKIGGIRDLESLQWQLLGLIFEVIPGDRAALLLTGESPEDFISAASWDRVKGPNHPVTVSQPIVRQVLEESEALLISDVVSDVKLRELKGESGAPVTSLMCVPIGASGRVLGIIYVDSCAPKQHFDRNHLQLLVGIAGIAGLALDNARHLQWLEGENQRLKADITLEHNMVGESLPMREIYQLIGKLAAADSSVLLYGESGTGKELAARAIHGNSARSAKAFVGINCAAINENLLESELFGHEKGAFTGAVVQKRGQIEIAEGGTLFMDEVAEMTPALQAKLLRVLQEREFLRVGGTKPIKANIRLIAATNKDLKAMVGTRTFREDLYYRLNVVTLKMPALRERREDIPLLANYFMSKYSEKCKRKVRGISEPARNALLHYEWPGNVRELENAIEHAVVLGSSDVIFPEDLPEVLLESQSADPEVSGGSYQTAVLNLKKKLIIDAVEQAGGNYTEAARLLGVHPNYLHRLIRNMDLKSSLRRHATGT